MYLTVFTGAIGKDYYIKKFMMGSSPHDEHRSSGPRPVYSNFHFGDWGTNKVQKLTTIQHISFLIDHLHFPRV